MHTTIDAAGRVVVPKALRERLGLTAGAGVELTESDGAVLLRPVGPTVRQGQRDGRPVLQVDGPVDPLTVEAVRALIQRDRR